MITPERIVPEGTLVAVGGNEDKTADLEVLRTICELPEGGTDVVEIIPTASNYPEEAAEQYIEPFQKLGCTTVNIMDIRDRDAANDPEHVQRILDADVVFFTGGDQLRNAFYSAAETSAVTAGRTSCTARRACCRAAARRRCPGRSNRPRGGCEPGRSSRRSTRYEQPPLRARSTTVAAAGGHGSARHTRRHR